MVGALSFSPILKIGPIPHPGTPAGYGHPESFRGSDKHFVFERPVSSSLKD